MTVAKECFEILARANRPISSKELARLIGNRQTRGSIESVLYKFVPGGCLRKVQYDCDNGCKTAWVFLKYPTGIGNKDYKSLSERCFDIRKVFSYLGRANKPVTTGELAELMGLKGSNRCAHVQNAMNYYVRKGYVRKVRCEWGSYGKVGYILVKMPKLPY